MNIKTYTGKQLVRSTKTRHVQERGGYDIYSHTLRTVSGNFVVIDPENTNLGTRDWEAFETLQEAQAKIERELRPNLDPAPFVSWGVRYPIQLGSAYFEPGPAYEQDRSKYPN